MTIEVQPSNDMLIAQKREQEDTPTDLADLAARKEEIRLRALKAMEQDNSEIETTEQAGDSDSEGPNRAARRLLQKEKALREQREAFEREQQEKVQAFENERKEWESKLAKYEADKEAARFNPIEHLKSLGFEDSELEDVATLIFFKANPELATPEVKSRLDKMEYQAELKRLEAKFEKQEEPEKAPEPEEPSQALVQYQQTLIDTANEVNAEVFPLTSQYIADGNDPMEVANAMYAAARQYAVETKGQGAPLTPEQCLERVEQQLAKMQITKNVEPQKQEQRQQSPSIRNKTAKVVTEVNTEKMTLKEQRDLARSRFYEKLREGRLIND